ncbi:MULTISPECIES: penicillin-binding protein activator [Cobetia]|uniref:penicillin-binding protein activator n=1 Tax=Cobetia TaxID=204286 RepID=UPI0015843650|nr:MULTISPECIES: penicillin-binding protein activator [Cobetia]MDI4660348.1 penicillin-binding protein activator [Cobetia sp. BMC6]NUJ55018.1 penicillin-binding protein activator [Cobetia marina]
MRQTWNRASANTLGTSSAIRQEAARRSRSGLRTLAGLAASALLLAGCAGQSPLSSGPGADALLAQAEQQQGQQAASTRLQAADILARSGDNAQAITIASDIDPASLEPQKRVLWALLLSRIALEQQDGWNTILATSVLEDGIQMSSDDQRTLRKRRGLALGMVGEPLASAQTLIALQADSDDLSINDTLWEQLTRLSPTQLNELASASPTASDWTDLLRLQRRFGGNIDQMFSAINDWSDANPQHPAARQMPQGILDLRELSGQEVRKIAVFLPESGSLKRIAQAIREGIEARHRSAIDNAEATPQLSFYDTSSADLKTLYARATMDGAQVVLGPLDKKLVSQLETQNSLPLPTLALNYGTHDSNRADNLLQYGLSAEDEARQVAMRAALDGHRGAAALVPNNAWGQRVYSAFRDRFEQEGGDIVSVERYNPKGAVSSAVKDLLSVSSQDQARMKSAKKSGSRYGRAHSGNIDMIFLLALPSYARQVPPMLDFYYAGDLPIYGTSHLYDGAPQPDQDGDLNGVDFVDIPWEVPEASSGGKASLPEVDTYRALSDASPRMLKLNAMGVDAYRLAQRVPLMLAGAGGELFGATGSLFPRHDGRIERTLPWAEFRGGVPRPPLKGANSRTVEAYTP